MAERRILKIETEKLTSVEMVQLVECLREVLGDRFEQVVRVETRPSKKPEKKT